MTSGRPRKPETGTAILDAALAVFGEVGYEGMTVEAVAARAGVGKATIYRRWSSKDDLIIAAIEEMTSVEVTDTGDFRADLIGLIGGAVRFMTTARAGVVFPRMAGEVASRTPLGRKYVNTVINPRREVLRGVIRRGIERGDLRGDLDVHLMADMLMGPIIMRKILSDLEPSSDLPARLIDSLMEGWLLR